MTRFPFLHTTGFAARGLTLLLMIVVTISASFAAERLPADESHGASALVIPHIFDHMDIPRTMSSSRRIPFQITSFPGGLSFFLAR